MFKIKQIILTTLSGNCYDNAEQRRSCMHGETSMDIGMPLHFF